MATNSRQVAGSSNAVRACVRVVLAGLGWKLKLDTADSIVAKTPASVLSWGEDVTIQFGRSEGGTLVTVESDATAQLISWGKNDDNIGAFFDNLEAALVQK
jgi:hypothetical protein